MLVAGDQGGQGSGVFLAGVDGLGGGQFGAFGGEDLLEDLPGRVAALVPGGLVDALVVVSG